MSKPKMPCSQPRRFSRHQRRRGFLCRHTPPPCAPPPKTTAPILRTTAPCHGRREFPATPTDVDNFTRETLVIEVRKGITGEQVVAAMIRIAAVRGAPKSIRVDNGPEFVSRALDQWAYLHRVTLDFSRPGYPTITGGLNRSTAAFATSF